MLLLLLDRFKGWVSQGIGSVDESRVSNSKIENPWYFYINLIQKMIQAEVIALEDLQWQKKLKKANLETVQSF